jgi:hypothetical protein
MTTKPADVARKVMSGLVAEHPEMDTVIEGAYLVSMARAVLAAEGASDALEAIFQLIDSGWLVRDNRQDHEDGWALKQINPVRKLGDAKRAHDALVRALDGEE